MPTKCIKLTIEYSKGLNILDSKEFFKELRDIQYTTYLACNRAMTYLYTNDMQNFIQKDIGLPKQDDKVVYGKSFSAWIENRMNEIMKGALSSNVAQTRQFVCKRYAQDKKAGLLKGDVSLSQFKRDIPLIIHNTAYSIIETNKGLGIEIRFFNLEKQKEIGIKSVKFQFPNVGASEKAVLRRLMDKSYKNGTIQIKFNERKKKWMCIISYTFAKEKKDALNENLVMGVDLGITKIATMSIYDSDKDDYIQMYWKDRVIDGKELIHYRQKIEARRRELSIAGKWASDNKRGHGYKTKMKSINRTGDKYNRFKETYNHKVSRYIIDMALKYRVGTIQMEDLSGFTEAQEESLLRNWSYYDLQQKVQYKAEEVGINVIFINPSYTSKRCSNCGNIDNANRDCKHNQAMFKCTVCSHDENADINASKNIAIPGIDIIIKDYLNVKL